jgi:tRNA pseudouridine38-40 synthase
MQEAARVFEGLHDFRAFTDASADEGSTKVKVEQVIVLPSPPFVLLRVAGSHFLWKMVRRIVGVLVEVGRGGMPVSAVSPLLGKDSPIPARLTAPASGLFLERVFHEGDHDERPLTPLLTL